MYSLLSIFFIIPLIFSHTFAGLGESFIIENGIGSFESVKVTIFFILIFCATLEMTLCTDKFFSKKTITLLLAIIGFVLIEYALFGPESIFGIGEKQHGSLFFGTLMWFGYLLSQIGKSHQKLFTTTIVGTAMIVASIAIIEYLFSYNIFSGFIDETGRSWGNGRATATLGNPNYVAGYLLICLPLLGFFSSNWKQYGFSGLIFLGIISTGSIIGMVLSVLYLVFLGLKRSGIPRPHSVFISIVLISGIILFEILYDNEKWLSLSSRFVLMKTTLLGMLSDTHTIIVGGGPNGIIEYYEKVRTSEIIDYFPQDMIIDSSHNIFIDILYKFGALGILALLGTLRYFGIGWKELTFESKGALLLAMIFFSLNVVILSAYLLIIYALIEKGKKR